MLRICAISNAVSTPDFDIVIFHYISYHVFPLSNHSIDKNQMLTANNG